MVVKHLSDLMAKPVAIVLGSNHQFLRFESMKVASATQAVSELLASGVIDRDRTTLVDSSSGVYAYALSLAAQRFGMRCHIIGSTTIDPVLKGQLAVLGTTLEQVPPSSSLKLDQNKRVELVGKYLAENPDAHWMRQYHDPIHLDGYHRVARESLSHLAGKSVVLVGGVGSGASTAGLAQGLEQLGATVEVVGIQPFGSISFGSEKIQDPEMLVAGIGSSIPFENIQYDLYNQIHWLEYEIAKRGSLRLLREHGIFAGFSSGASFIVGELIAALAADRIVVSIGADMGFRYADHMFGNWEETLFRPAAEVRWITEIDQLSRPWSAMQQADGFGAFRVLNQP